MLTWDRVLYEQERRQDERAFAAQQRLIGKRNAPGHASRPAKARRRRLARLGAQWASRGGYVRSHPVISGQS